MAIFHVKIAKMKRRAGAAGFAHYLAREEQDRATQHARYLSRDSDPAKDDLVLYKEVNLPAWAQDGAHFFTMAEQYERHGGIVARTYEVALPRELSWQGRSDLAEDIGEAFFHNHPYVFAVHCPKARDGFDQPHVHFMVCERLMDGIARSPKHFFSRAAADPAHGGAPKARLWNHLETFVHVREGIATLINTALEREGVPVAVSHERLKARGIERPPEVELTTAERWALATGHLSPKHQENLRQRETTQAEWHPWEAEHNWKEWQAYTARWGLGTERHEAIGHVRERFEEQTGRETPTQARGASEMTSKAPAEMMDDESAWWMSDEPAYRSDDPAWMTSERQEETRQQDRTRGTKKKTADLTERLEVPLIGNKISHIYHMPDSPSYGDVNPKSRVKFWSHAAARAAGYRQARNRHYAEGDEKAKQEEKSKARTWQRAGRLSGLSAADETGGRLQITITNAWDNAQRRAKERGMEW